ncbi:hypothetical protein [Neisseria sp.]|uniref:hypothetical protein n=1 Tax=Neisseria sp. TaxID=192066 RepID=UPI0035A161C6
MIHRHIQTAIHPVVTVRTTNPNRTQKQFGRLKNTESDTVLSETVNPPKDNTVNNS